MTFSLQDNGKVFGFTYNASTIKMTYGGATQLTNNQTEATFYGKYLPFTPTCFSKAKDDILNWFNNPDGVVISIPYFNTVPNTPDGVTAGIYNWRAYISNTNRLVLKSFIGLTPQPYVVTSAIPITSTSHTINAGKFVGTPGSQVQVKFGFRIKPKVAEVGYSRTGQGIQFNEIPFLVIPPPDN